MNIQHFLRSATVALVFALPLASQAAGSFMNGQSYYGQPAQAAQAERVVDVGTARHLNVRYGETVSFRAQGGQLFTWTFNGLDQRAVDLAKIAPAGFNAQALRVFIGRNVLTRG